MPSIPTRAPIDYDDLRRPYNLVRATSGVVLALAVSVWVAMSGNAGSMVLALPALVVVADAWYRGTNPVSTPMPGLVIDTTMIGIALLLHGPGVAIHAVVVMTILVSASVALSAVEAVAVVAYAIAWSIGSTALGASSTWLLTVLGPSDGHGTFDVVIIVVFIVATAAVLGVAVRVILAAQDRQDEALARERRALELKNEFVSMVSHELRTPLTGIAGFTGTLAESWKVLPSGDVDEFLSIMGHETEHLANLVEDILVIPRLEAGQLRLDLQELDVAVEAHAVASVIFADSDYAVAIPSGVAVLADRTRLRQIMRNLLENAKKYGGDEILIEGELSGPGMYTVAVSDNGVGVAPEDRERIFQHFEQLSTGDGRLQQGVGLGLPIARRLARAMGGDLWYEDRFPVGARFRFNVPTVSTRRSEAGAQRATAS